MDTDIVLVVCIFNVPLNTVFILSDFSYFSQVPIQDAVVTETWPKTVYCY